MSGSLSNGGPMSGDSIRAGPAPMIRVDGLRKVYGYGPKAVEALRDVSFAIPEGEFVSVVGPSGCGKSTLMLILAGIESKTAGRVEVAGRTVDRPLDDVGIVFQDHLLLDWRTSLDNVMLQVEFRELDRRRYLPRARELLQSVGLAGFESKRPWELSGGMRQRVSVCRALVHDPTLLFMDEPFGALDALTREQMRIDLEKLWLGTGKTVIFITHSISEAVLLSDRVLVFSARPGTILENVEIELERPRSVKAIETAAFRRYSEQILEAFHQTGVLRY